MKDAPREVRLHRAGLAVTAVKVALGVLFVGTLAWVIPGAFQDDPDPMPGWLWSIGALTLPVALALTWRADTRPTDRTFFIALGSVLLGLGGAGWGSVVAPVLGVLTLVGLAVSPRAASASAARRSRRRS